eukprot:259782-Prorocentrum_minimum.AAC.2
MDELPSGQTLQGQTGEIPPHPVSSAGGREDGGDRSSGTRGETNEDAGPTCPAGVPENEWEDIEMDDIALDDDRKPLTSYADSDGGARHRPALHTHHLPEQPTWLDYLLYFPLSTKKYFERMIQTFGWRFVAFVVMVYGIQQGWAMGWSTIATYWFLLSPRPKVSKE